MFIFIYCLVVCLCFTIALQFTDDSIGIIKILIKPLLLIKIWSDGIYIWYSGQNILDSSSNLSVSVYSDSVGQFDILVKIFCDQIFWIWARGKHLRELQQHQNWNLHFIFDILVKIFWILAAEHAEEICENCNNNKRTICPDVSMLFNILHFSTFLFLDLNIQVQFKIRWVRHMAGVVFREFLTPKNCNCEVPKN